jgi:hypothetical protein
MREDDSDSHFGGTYQVRSWANKDVQYTTDVHNLQVAKLNQSLENAYAEIRLLRAEIVRLKMPQPPPNRVTSHRFKFLNYLHKMWWGDNEFKNNYKR